MYKADSTMYHYLIDTYLWGITFCVAQRGNTHVKTRNAILDLGKSREVRDFAILDLGKPREVHDYELDCT